MAKPHRVRARTAVSSTVSPPLLLLLLLLLERLTILCHLVFELDRQVHEKSSEGLAYVEKTVDTHRQRKKSKRQQRGLVAPPTDVATSQPRRCTRKR